MPIAQEEPKRPHFGEAGNEARDAPTTCCATNPVMRDASGRATDPPNAYVAWLEAGSGGRSADPCHHPSHSFPGRSPTAPPSLLHPVRPPPPLPPRCTRKLARAPSIPRAIDVAVLSHEFMVRPRRIRPERSPSDGRTREPIFVHSPSQDDGVAASFVKTPPHRDKNTKNRPDLYRLTAAGKLAREGA